MDKKTQRLIIKEKIKALSKENIDLESLIVCNALLKLPEIENNQNILVYMSLPNELCLDFFIKKMFANNKNLFLPKVNEDKLEIIPYNCDTKFDVGSFGIKEPQGFATSVLPEVIILPLLGYDKNKNRLGKGKGFYDKFINFNCIKIGVGFNCQECENLQTESFDVKMDIIIKESGIIR